jgi:uncharacterized protein (TIRG00374 family)
MADSSKKQHVDIKRRFFSLPTLMAFCIAAAFLAFMLTRFDVDLSGTWENIKSCNPWYYLLAIGIHYTTFLFRGARWRVLLRNVQVQGRANPPIPYLSGLILLSWFANSITWFRLGDAYRAYAYAGDTKATFSRTIGTVVAERVYDVILVFLLLLAASLVLFLSEDGGLVGEKPSWIFLGIALALVMGMLLILGMMVVFRSRFARLLPTRVERVYYRFYQGTLGSFNRIPMAFLFGALGWMAEVGRLYFVVQALGLPLTLPMVLFVTVANAILTLVPLTPGGLGIVETGVTGVLVLALAQSDALSVALLDRSISYLSVIIMGALYFVVRELLKRGRRRAEEVEIRQE